MIIIDIFDFRYKVSKNNCLAREKSVIAPEQCRAARGLLGWSQQDLAQEAEVGIVTVRQLEAGLTRPRRSTMVVVRQTLEAAGVEFIDENGGGVGVRLREPRRGRPRVSPV
jgi:transcriptional regulator with XRE-family HTH domain